MSLEKGVNKNTENTIQGQTQVQSKTTYRNLLLNVKVRLARRYPVHHSQQKYLYSTLVLHTRHEECISQILPPTTCTDVTWSAESDNSSQIMLYHFRHIRTGKITLNHIAVTYITRTINVEVVAPRELWA